MECFSVYANRDHSLRVSGFVGVLCCIKCFDRSYLGADMKKRHGQLLAEAAICLVLLVATSGSLAMMVQAISKGRLGNRNYVAERIKMGSVAEQFLAVEMTEVESVAEQVSSQGRIQASVAQRELQGVAVKQIDLQSARYRRLSLTVWRFSEAVIEEEGANEADSEDSNPGDQQDSTAKGVVRDAGEEQTDA